MIRQVQSEAMQFFDAVQRQREQVLQAHKPLTTQNLAGSLEAGAFVPVEFFLSEVGYVAAEKKVVPVAGHRLVYLRQGSAPGGRLILNPSKVPISPGSIIDAPFKSLEFLRAEESAYNGKARFLVCSAPEAKYFEDPNIPTAIDPPLLSLSVGNVTESRFNWGTHWITIAENTQPTSELCNISGWRKIRLYIYGDSDGAGANPLLSCEIIPWFITDNDNSPVAASALEQGTERIFITDPGSASGYRFRVVTLEVFGHGTIAMMGLEFRSVLPAAITEMKWAAFGLE